MSFQAYLTNIKAKTRMESDDFKKLSDQKDYSVNGQLKPEIKAGEIVTWLKADFDLGQGHAMAIYALLKGIRK
jgi:hypothetical protein